MQEQKTKINTVPFAGGCDTFHEPMQLNARYSVIQNFRPTHPGFKKRGGMAKHATTADGTNRCLSLFQFSKGKKTERHFYAQMSDDDVLEATDNPPAVTAAAFGSEVFAGSASSLPASWAVCDDVAFFANGVDQHRVIYGNTTPVKKFVVFKGAAAPADFPEIGQDYSEQVSDGDSTTVAVLDSLGDLAVDYDCVFICTPVPAKQFTWTVSAVNGTAAASQLKYRKSDKTWAACASFTDNTSADSKTLAQPGTMTWTTPTDSMPSFMYGTWGYWYQWSLSSGDLDAEVEVSAVTFEANWTALYNEWDGVLLDGVECQFYDQSAATYLTYGTTAIDISLMTSSDRIYIGFTDPIEALYVDVGDTPNTTTSLTLTIKYWNNAWASIGTYTDETACFNNSGYIAFARRTDEQPLMFNGTQYYAYWYELAVSNTLSDDSSIGIQAIPYLNINDFGRKGVCNAEWKGRMVYTFDLYPDYIYIASESGQQILNGADFDVRLMGDGRGNRIRSMKRFYNDLVVFQEEKGEAGGCTTVVEGYSPETFGELVISNRYGTMNANSVDIVDGFIFGDKERGKALFSLSRYGVLVSNGRYVTHVPGFEDVANYFDQTDATDCIRAGYEDHMWLKYDSAYHGLRIGLVTGSSASVCNTFLFYDLKEMKFYTDSITPAVSTMCEVDAASGAIPVLQYGGGTADGFVYRLNTGTNDVTTPIDAYATLEIDGQGEEIVIDDIALRMKVQSAGTVTITPYINGVAGTAFPTLAQTAARTNETFRRHRWSANQKGNHISLKIQHNTASESCHLLDYGIGIKAYGQQ